MAPIELSMIAVDRDRPGTRGFERLTERVLTLAGIYGPNASGKSNVLEALAWLSAAVGGSLRGWDDVVPREPFRFGLGPATASRYEVDLVVNGVHYAYQLEADEAEVRFEGLYGYPERRRRTLFEREGLDLTFRRGLAAGAGTRELLTPTSLALTVALRLRVPQLAPVGRFLAGIGILGLRRPSFATRAMRLRGDRSATSRLFADQTDPGQPTLFDIETESAGDRAAALSLLRFADLGIDDVAVSLDPDDAHRVRLIHRGSGQHLAFDLDDESHGTRIWFRLIGPAIRALRSGRPLVFDEIDTSLHPRLSARLLELFQARDTNPHGAQLIFTSHDTSLLNQLNRDEVWLTEKGADAATTLTALAEYGGDKVRRSVNLERAYLQGRFGALPDLDQAILRRVLASATGGADG